MGRTSKWAQRHGPETCPLRTVARAELRLDAQRQRETGAEAKAGERPERVDAALAALHRDTVHFVVVGLPIDVAVDPDEHSQSRAVAGTELDRGFVARAVAGRRVAVIEAPAELRADVAARCREPG